MTPSPTLASAQWHPGGTHRLVIWLALLITLKSAFLAFFVIPPADIPDESGHYAYVKDIAGGNLFPLLGRATIPRNLWMDAPDSQQASTPPRTNYIVQHPPLYYVVAAIPYKITSLFTSDRWYLIRFTRLVSAICLGLLVLVLFRITQDLGISPSKGMLLSASVAFIPSMSNLSAGITNDPFLTLVSAMATLHFVRYVLGHHLRSAYLCALWLCIAGATKMTAWIMIAAFVAILVFELQLPWRRWLVHAPLIGLVSVLAPLWWMGRNIVHFGNPFFVGVTSAIRPEFAQLTFPQFVESHSFLYPLAVSFYGLFGFSGYCQTPELVHHCVGIRLIHITDYPFLYFALVALALALGFVVLTLWRAWKVSRDQQPALPPTSLQQWVASLLPGRRPRSVILAVALVAGAALCVWVWPHLHLEPGLTEEPYINALLLVPLLLTPAALCIAALAREPSDRLIFHGIVVTVFFGLALASQIYKGYLLFGQMRGVQGRYFYPYVPLLLASVALMLEKLRVPHRLLLWTVLGLTIADVYTYVQKVIPFFESVRI